MKQRTLLFCAVLSLTFAAEVAASPRPLPFTYQHEQLAAGDAEFEQFADMTPVRALAGNSGRSVHYGLYQFQTEFEYGITDRLELGLYFTYVPAPGGDFALVPRAQQGNGLKQRLRWQLAATGEWPVDVALYGEVTENEREIEVEGKVLLQRRVERFRFIANLVAEQEFYFAGNEDFVLSPSAGVTFEASARIQPGIEWWMQAEYPLDDPPPNRPFELGPHHYVGPVILLNLGRLWWTTAAYLRVSDYGHSMQEGESFGPVWFRTIVGFGI